MKKIYKIFGAVAIIGLFLLSSVASTSMAAPRQQNPVVRQEESLQRQTQPQLQRQQGYMIPAGGVIADYEDGAYIVPDFEPETLPYAWEPIRQPDLATGLIFKVPQGNHQAKIWFVIRNYGLKASPGGLADVFVPRKLHYSTHTILPKLMFPLSIGQPFSVGPFPFRIGSTVLVHIDTSGDEGARGINWRVGYCIGVAS